MFFFFSQHCRQFTLYEWKERLTSLTLSLRSLAMGSLSSPPTVKGSLLAGAGGTVSRTSFFRWSTNDGELVTRTCISPITSGFSNIFCCWYSSSIFAWNSVRSSRGSRFFEWRFFFIFKSIRCVNFNLIVENKKIK